MDDMCESPIFFISNTESSRWRWEDDVHALHDIEPWLSPGDANFHFDVSMFDSPAVFSPPQVWVKSGVTMDPLLTCHLLLLSHVCRDVNVALFPRMENRNEARFPKECSANNDPSPFYQKWCVPVYSTVLVIPQKKKTCWRLGLPAKARQPGLASSFEACNWSLFRPWRVWDDRWNGWWFLPPTWWRTTHGS